MNTWLTVLAGVPLAVGGAVLLHAEEFTSNGVKIHYVVMGKGDPVILVHGLYSSARMNWRMPGTMARLAKHYQVIAFDNRGHGQSGKPVAEDQYGVQMAEDVVRLMDHLHLPEARVVGYRLSQYEFAHRSVINGDVARVDNWVRPRRQVVAPCRRQLHDIGPSSLSLPATRFQMVPLFLGLKRNGRDQSGWQPVPNITPKYRCWCHTRPAISNERVRQQRMTLQ